MGCRWSEVQFLSPRQNFNDFRSGFRQSVLNPGAVAKIQPSFFVLRGGVSRYCAAAAVLMLSSCAGPPARSPAGTLTGTVWELHAIQSMDDAQGTMRIADPSHFTLRFDADGRAILRLDCNRGAGSWQAKASSEDSGTLTFGPIAATRALCPPPRLDERVARDLAYVRGYRLKDGNLYLSLMADGGIYEWRPLRE